jgi:CcmD family protein
MSGTAYVLGAILVIWLGVLFYLVALDRKVSRLEGKVHRDEP